MMKDTSKCTPRESYAPFFTREEADTLDSNFPVQSQMPNITGLLETSQRGRV